MSARRRLTPCVLFACLALGAGGCVKPTPVERAMSLARQSREAEGIALLRQDLAAHPEHDAARRLLIRFLAVQSNLPAARDEVEALAARLPPGDPSAWIELGHALELVHKFEEAMAAYQTASESSPSSPLGPREAGLRAARWGEWAEAETWLTEAVKRGGASGEIWHTLGLVRLNLHDAAGAREAYGQGILLDPKGADCWLGLATVALSERDWAGALYAYDGAIRLRPEWGDGELGRAWALARLGRRVEAAKALDVAEERGANPSALAKQRALLRREETARP